MENIIGFSIIFAIFAIVIVSGIVSEKKREKNFRLRLKEEFGKEINLKYSDERTASLNGYYRYHSKEAEKDYIDDITWNDLECERIYRQINHCYSSAGDEYLYYLLHKPEYHNESKEEKKLDKMADFFMENPEIREDYQVIFAKLGRTGKFSIYKYLELLNSLFKIKNYTKFYFIKFILLWIILLASIVYLCFFPMPGVLFFLAIAIISMLLYFSQKKDIEAFLISFEYILRILKTAEVINKHKNDLLEEECNELITIRKKLSAVSTSSLIFLKSGSSAVGSSDIMEFAIALIKIITHFDLFIFQKMLFQVVNHEDDIDRMITILGRIESSISIASYRTYLDYWCKPDFSSEEEYSVEDATHPLIHQAVCNSFRVTNGMLITGSNASGKSTFLRTSAVCALLAETIYTVPAKRYYSPRFRIFSSISLKDNPELNESYYMVEIKSVRRMMEALSQYQERILIFIDEVLRGTNTLERISAASEIIRYFTECNATVFAATHDRELTYILEKQLDNYHFEEIIEDNDISFPYKLNSGRSNSQNAIKLLSLMGYPEEVVTNADRRAKEFVQKGEWT